MEPRRPDGGIDAEEQADARRHDQGKRRKLVAEAGVEGLAYECLRSSMALVIQYPKAAPKRPPPMLRTVASATNWKRMSRRFAPIALRMPISRVRSVTDTSMMFMIPMPPTKQRYARDDAEEHDQGVRRLLQGFDGALLADDGEVVLLGDAVAQTEHSARLLDAPIDVLQVPDLDVDEAYRNVAGQRALAA